MSTPKYINPHIKTLEPIKDKSQIVVLAIEDKTDRFVRTAVLHTRFTLFNAILQLCDKNYLSLAEKDKIDSADQLKRKILSKLNQENVEQSTSVVNKLNLETKIKDAITEKYTNPESTTLTLVFELLKKEELLNIVEEVFDDNEKTISVCRTNFLQKAKTRFLTLSEKLLKHGVEKEKIDRCVVKLTETLEKIIDKASDNVSTKVVSNTFSVNEELLKILSKRMNFNIYIFSGDTRLPKIFYNSHKCEKSVMLLELGSHYEILGMLMKDNIIKREFSESEPILKKFRLCIEDKSFRKLFREYPELKKVFDDASSSSTSSSSSSASPNYDFD
jgi:hypothetical protein